MPPPLFLRPSRPSRPRFPPGIAPPAPLLFLFSFLTAPVPHSYPLLLRHPHYYSLSGGPSLSLLTERFHRRRFFSGLVAVCRLSLYRILSSTGAPYEARVALRSPRERINECFTLSPEVGPFAFARARSVLPLSTMFSAHSVFHDPFLSSLAFTREPVFRQRFPFSASSDRT